MSGHRSSQQQNHSWICWVVLTGALSSVRNDERTRRSERGAAHLQRYLQASVPCLEADALLANGHDFDQLEALPQNVAAWGHSRAEHDHRDEDEEGGAKQEDD
jgi:hypothetical protein